MTSSWAKIIGSVAAVFAASAVVALVYRALKKQQEKIDSDIVAFRPDAVEAEAEAEAEAQPEPAPEAEAPEAAPAGETPASPLAPGPESGPNPNPVLAGAAEAPRTADGRFDAEKICSPADFADWEDLGCQG